MLRSPLAWATLLASLAVAPSAPQAQSLHGARTVVNRTPDLQFYSLPFGPVALPADRHANQVKGSVGFTLTDNDGDGALIASPALYSARVANHSVHQLFAPMAVSVGAFQSRSDADAFAPVFVIEGGLASFVIEFGLTPFDTVTFTALLQAEPMPAEPMPALPPIGRWMFAIGVFGMGVVFLSVGTEPVRPPASASKL